MKLNVGCGRRVMDGWTNVDVVASPLAPRPPEILAPATQIPLHSESVEVIQAIHLFEHLYYWEAPLALAEWHRLLRPGGELWLEMPDILKCAKNLLENRSGPKHPDQLHMWGLFGDPRGEDPYMIHRWSWTYKTIKPLLQKAGFIDIREKRTHYHNIGRDIRDFRVEARKA